MILKLIQVPGVVRTATYAKLDASDDKRKCSCVHSFPLKCPCVWALVLRPFKPRSFESKL